MTRDKAKEIISYHKNLVDKDTSGLLDKQLEYQAIDMAIKALEQESILDKIRAEIKDYFSITCDGNCDNCNRVVKNPCGESVDGAWVLHIIDKHKEERKTVANTGEAEVHPINEDIAKGFEEFTKMMFRQGQAESEE